MTNRLIFNYWWPSNDPSKSNVHLIVLPHVHDQSVSAQEPESIQNAKTFQNWWFTMNYCVWIIAHSGQTSPPGVGRWWTLRCMGSRSRSRSPSLFTNCTGTRNASKGSLSQEFCLFGRRTSVYIWVCIDAQRERISESTFRKFLKRNPYQIQSRHSITLTV